MIRSRSLTILTTLPSLAALAALSSACGAALEPLHTSRDVPNDRAGRLEQLADLDDTGDDLGDLPPGNVDTPTAPPTATPPSSLQCASEGSFAEGEAVPHVWRASAWLDGVETMSTSISRGRQLAARTDPETGLPVDGSVAPTPESHALHVFMDRMEPNRVVLRGDTVRIDVSDQDGDRSWFAGTLEIATETGSESHEVTCWDWNTLQGSPWGGAPGTLRAHFDWATGGCLGADGKPARNELPIAFVRETGFGECADFAGIRLNGDDFSGTSTLQWTWLAGANLAGAELFFADLTNGSLYGTNLEGFSFGYATVTGAIDANTTLPGAEGCTTSESPWSGTQMACTR